MSTPRTKVRANVVALRPMQIRDMVTSDRWAGPRCRADAPAESGAWACARAAGHEETGETGIGAHRRHIHAGVRFIACPECGRHEPHAPDCSHAGDDPDLRPMEWFAWE